MSRRGSVLSTSSSKASVSNGHIGSPIPPSMSRGSTTPSSRKLSVSKLPTSQDLDPDDLFTKYTVSDVKFVQSQLRTDADAKQEELRLMVGERYRDLLQASTSIIAIAKSSNRVLDALQETRIAIESQRLPTLPKSESIVNQDSHLHSLQLLAAHIKLLLDAPEHLWRLIERKRYFTAAWLFLLSRVIHLALRQDEDGERLKLGIDVTDQFPLIQRQWDAVSQFRSQIVHKATLSLREPTITAPDICSTALTLHLLDSKPLTDTLAVFLEQRHKSLQVLLSFGTDASIKRASSIRRANGQAPQDTNSKGEFKNVSTRQIRDAAQAVLEAVASTVKGARDVFGSSSSTSSLAESVLEYIQSDASPSTSLPSELQLTTESLLMTLPSSTQFLLLPANLRFYKPYVDLASTSSHVSAPDLDQHVERYFTNAANGLRKSLSRWLRKISSVKDVWQTRNYLRQWLSESARFTSEEAGELTRILDQATRERVLDIWQVMLAEAQTGFGASIELAISRIRDPGDTPVDSYPIQHLLQAPQLPSNAALGPVDTSFLKYETGLRRQLIGRTALLDETLGTLENCASLLQNDMLHVLAFDDDATRALVEDLKKQYQPHASVLCDHIVEHLQEKVSAIPDASARDVNGLVFAASVAREFNSPSSFVNHLCLASPVVEAFNKKVNVLHDLIINRWRNYTISTVLAQNTSAKNQRDSPSLHLTNALFWLSRNIEEVGWNRHTSDQARATERTLLAFLTSIIETDSYFPASKQSIHDLVLLQALAGRREGAEWECVCRGIDEKVSNLRGLIPDMPETNAKDYLARHQLLFAPLLAGAATEDESNTASSYLLPLGVPSLDQRQEFQPAMDVTKPQVRRFNMLLVG
ncbi:hypothetical protein CYLTODRAFT_452897 [Cylindrobasidium torrendii FP15055 ss-10]|uniref:Conserved oligomeric Golgi complex subunit 1 n=1 Tax=Cylindrobasidium torrendii FP15055 ss-10 TaxID=1314674 RepID=A0A0D7BG74_9AGAR|nr:hypothetical protein CYLTODRAFT_452897 [Cylindrobasidium torrendii FP15055 ss-10]